MVRTVSQTCERLDDLNAHLVGMRVRVRRGKRIAPTGLVSMRVIISDRDSSTMWRSAVGLAWYSGVQLYYAVQRCTWVQLYRTILYSRPRYRGV